MFQGMLKLLYFYSREAYLNNALQVIAYFSVLPQLQLKLSIRNPKELLYQGKIHYSQQCARLITQNAGRYCVCKQYGIILFFHHIDGDNSNTVKKLKKLLYRQE